MMPPRSSRPWLALATLAVFLGATASSSAAPVIRAGQGWLLRLKSGPFDPLRDEAPRLPADLSAALPLRDHGTAGSYHVVQFPSTPGTEEREALAGFGLSIAGYLPDHALIVLAPRGLPPPGPGDFSGARFVGPFLPAYKLSAELIDVPAAREERPRARLDAVLFHGEDARPLARALDARFGDGTVLHVKASSQARLTVTAPPGRLRPLLRALIHDPAVQLVERRRPLRLHNDHSVWIGQSYDRLNGPLEASAADPKPYPVAATVWARGLTGTGQIIAVADATLEVDECYFADPTRPVTPQAVPPPAPLSVDPEHRKLIAVNDVNGAGFPRDTFRHGTHVAGSTAGDNLDHPAGPADAGHDHGDGMAPHARILFEDISLATSSACTNAVGVSSIEELLEQEYASGARISTNSFGSDGGMYTASSAEVDRAAWLHEDLLILFSAGNEGTAGVSSFAAAKNSVAVGATGTYDPGAGRDPEDMAGFSARGPTTDGRLKPDITAPGVSVISSRFLTTYRSDELDPQCDAADPDVCFPFFGGCYRTETDQTCTADVLTGTSMASPTVAGLAALARQYFEEGFYPSGARRAEDAVTPSAALLKAVLLNGARNMIGSDTADSSPLEDAPSNVQGWGRVLLDDALYFAGDSRGLVVRDVPNGGGLKTGEATHLELAVTSPDEPLEVTLVWTDPPAEPAAAAALVNDLDLEMVSPQGALFRGNQWTVDDPARPGDKVSAPDPPGRDAANNVEGLLVASPSPGSYDIVVRGVSVPGYHGSATQGYALVASGAVAVPGEAPPVPDGSFGSPMTAGRDDEAPGVRVTWDAGTCPAAGFKLLHGPLSGVGSFELGGAECALDPSGVHLWSEVPAGDLWFVVVGDDASGTEGSWGRQSDGTHRRAGQPSAECGAVIRVDTDTCP
jgi:hypothetical protein